MNESGSYQPYEIRRGADIVDRVGGGDSFAAGLLYALHDPELSTSHESDCLRRGVELSQALDPRRLQPRPAKPKCSP